MSSTIHQPMYADRTTPQIAPEMHQVIQMERGVRPHLYPQPLETSIEDVDNMYLTSQERHSVRSTTTMAFTQPSSHSRSISRTEKLRKPASAPFSAGLSSGWELKPLMMWDNDEVFS